MQAPPAAPVIAIASGKGGVGKSTIALNLAVASERSCTLVDLDLGTANLDVMCGVSPSRRLDAELFSAGGPDLSRVIVRTPHGFTALRMKHDGKLWVYDRHSRRLAAVAAPDGVDGDAGATHQLDLALEEEHVHVAILVGAKRPELSWGVPQKTKYSFMCR